MVFDVSAAISVTSPVKSVFSPIDLCLFFVPLGLGKGGRPCGVTFIGSVSKLAGFVTFVIIMAEVKRSSWGYQRRGGR